MLPVLCRAVFKKNHSKLLSIYRIVGCVLDTHCVQFTSVDKSPHLCAACVWCLSLVFIILHSRHGRSSANVPTQVSKGTGRNWRYFLALKPQARQGKATFSGHRRSIWEEVRLRGKSSEQGGTQWCREDRLCSHKHILFEEGLGMSDCTHQTCKFSGFTSA